MAQGWGRRWKVGAQVGLVSLLGVSPLVADWEKGTTALQAGRYEEAVQELREVVEAHPEYAAAYYMLGTAQHSLEQSSEAIASFRRAVELDKTSAKYAFSLAQAFLSTQQPERVLTTLEAHSPADLPEAMRVRYAETLAAAVGQSEAPEKALVQLERAARSLPQVPPLWLALGKARGKADDFKGSFQAYQKALELNPQDSVAGRLAVRQAWLVADAEEPPADLGWYRKAALVAEQLAAAEPSVTHASLAGDSYLHAKNYAAARRWLETALAADSNRPGTALSLARCSLGLEEDQRALEELEAAYRKAQVADDSEVLVSIARSQGFAYHKVGDYRRAAEAYRRAGDEAKAVEMMGFQQLADSNKDVDRNRKECLAKKRAVDLDRKEMEAKRALFSVEEWLKIEGGFARQLAECQRYLDVEGVS
ncbi:MAG: tetratricopeptide repeat protein [Deltaproteobacteria bacterium]|nr:tetratricopeptide repeat protein [Deltaproteobacteria bacterium]